MFPFLKVKNHHAENVFMCVCVSVVCLKKKLKQYEYEG